MEMGAMGDEVLGVEVEEAGVVDSGVGVEGSEAVGNRSLKRPGVHSYRRFRWNCNGTVLPRNHKFNLLKQFSAIY